MTPIDYVKAIKRRWVDVVLAVMVAAAIGFALSEVAPAGPQTETYEATSVMLASGDYYTPGLTSLDALKELTTVGEVPERVAAELEYEGEPLDLATQVEVEIVKEAGILRVIATSTDRHEAEQLSNAFARNLVAFLQETRTTSVADQNEDLRAQLEEVQEQIDEKEVELRNATPVNRSLIEEEYNALIRSYGLLYESYRQLATTSTDTVGLQIVQPGIGLAVDSGGFQPPQSRLSRVLLAAILGLISGIVLVLLLDRFDSRIRTKKAAEKHFTSPVLAEIPFISRLRRKGRGLVLEEEPRSHAADSFRMLATMLSTPGGGPDDQIVPGNGNGNGNGNGYMADAPAPLTTDGPPRTILVTSAGPSDGKTTVAANLAVAFGQRGKRVIVLSCDLRRPSIHRLFDVDNDVGIADWLDGGEPQGTLNGTVRETKFPNVWIVPSGPPPNAPGRLLASPQMRRALEKTREAADVTIIDTAPILTTSDAANLIPHVDAVVLIGRAGRTTAEIARQTSQLIGRLGGRVRGVVLNAAVESSVPRRYYYYRYYRARPKAKRTKGSPRLARHSSEP
jgi:protein-tyrosine kinase